MLQQTMLELANPFDAYARELGYCMVMFMIAPGALQNPQFIVRVYGTGEMHVCDMKDLKIYGIPSIDGLVPNIPTDWQVKSE